MRLSLLIRRAVREHSVKSGVRAGKLGMVSVFQRLRFSPFPTSRKLRLA